jgi:signal transduction histidine kinase
VETIERNAGAMAELVDELLDMSSLVSGRLDLQTQPVDLGRTIDSALDSIRPASQAKQIRMERTFDGDAVVVTGDPARIRQIIWNLVANAVKFTNPGGRVAVTLGRVESFAHVAVTDSGKGIEPAFMPYLFDPFRQEVVATARARGGLGLGLAITRRLVELHGGTIEAKSDGPGCGSTFTVTLPLGSGDVRTASERPRR